MRDVRYAKENDKAFWLSLDAHITEEELEKKFRDRRGYVVTEDGIPCGVLRYNMFWDSIPFCTLLFVKDGMRRKGIGRELMEFWEHDMKASGHGMVMTSTQSDETAQHFYRRLGYTDAGSLVISVPGYEQPSELFFVKKL